jgi:hypothetical protein
VIVLHLSEFPNERFVGGKVAENVSRLILEFLIPHGFEFYTLGETGEQLKRLASYVLACGKDRLLASDLTTNVRDFRGLSLFEVRERASPLVAGGWLDPVDRTPMCKAWWVNNQGRLCRAGPKRGRAQAHHHRDAARKETHGLTTIVRFVRNPVRWRPPQENA